VRRDAFAFAMLTLFGVFMYAAPAEWIPGVAVLRPALLTSGLAAALMALRRLGRGEPLVLDGVRGGALLGFCVLAVASMSWSVNPAVTRDHVIELLKLVAVYFTLVNVVTTRRRLVVLCGALVLASVVTSIGVINWYNRGEDLVEGFRARWVGVYADPNHMAMDMVLVVPLAVAFLARKGSAWTFRLACAAAAALAVVAIVVSHSRGGFIGLSVAMGFWAIREKRRLQALCVGALLFVGLLLFAPESFWARNETVASFEEDASAMGRVYAWETAGNMSADRPLLGVGLGAFRDAWFDYAPPQARRAYVAHNIFLDVVGELGWVGLALFLVFVSAAVGGAFRAAQDAEAGWVARALGAAMTGYLVCDLFSGYLLSAHFYVLFGLAAAADRLALQEARARAAVPSGAGGAVPGGGASGGGVQGGVVSPGAAALGLDGSADAT
jgi:probable O-glycosylation ligase (exosortase A-associated)